MCKPDRQGPNQCPKIRSSLSLWESRRFTPTDTCLAASAVGAASLLGAVDTPYAGRDQRDACDDAGGKFLGRFVRRDVGILGKLPRMAPQRDTARAEHSAAREQLVDRRVVVAQHTGLG